MTPSRTAAKRAAVIAGSMAPDLQILRWERLSHKAVMGAGRQYGTSDVVRRQAGITKFQKDGVPGNFPGRGPLGEITDNQTSQALVREARLYIHTKQSG
jgi:hypothetical protein